MGKFRTKLKGQTKGKRWAKGQSSSSNPETHKYRDQAKSRFFQVNLGPSNLTSDALQKHNSFQTTNLIEKNEPANSVADDNQSFKSSTFQTYNTFASDWSECSNVSFSKLMVNFRTNSALHKEMLAVLAAITEVIKSNGGSETSTEYYAALMTTLEVADSEDSITAILSLLAMGIKTVPQSVLQVQFSNATNVFLQILSQYSQSDNNVITRSVLTCLAVCLRMQEISVWYNSSTVQVFDAILTFVNHSKPKIRKAAQHAISSVLNGSYFMLQSTDDTATVKPPDNHPVGAHIAQFCIKQIESSMGQTGGQTTILHTLALLKDIIQVFPKTQIKLVCETLLKIMTLNNALINANALQVIYSLFSGKKTVIPALLNDQLIGALYDYQPSATDTQPTLAWMAVMKQAHIHLADVDTAICMKRLPTLFHILLKLWLTERPEIVSAVTMALDDLLKDCIGGVTENPQSVSTHEQLLRQCFSIVEQGLDYQYHTAWSHVLHLMNTVFKVAGSNCQDMLISYLKTLSSLRDSYKFSYNTELEYAVGAAIRSMGPDKVLQVIPLTNDGSKIILDRSWLLPVLKENIQGSTLEYFGSKIRPLAEICDNESKIMFNKKNAVGGHSMELFASQLWSLFPSFCNSPSDIIVSFKKIAQIIGIKISNDKNLRLPLMAGLRKLINQSQENTKVDCVQELSRFAKNYVPILFNIYTAKPNGSDEEGQRLAALDTIKVYLSIAPTQLRNTLFNEATKQLSSSEDGFLRESIFDLIRLLAVYQNKDVLEQLYKQCIIKLYENKNHKEQKKAYRLLEDICGSDETGCQEFVQANRKSLRGLLLKTLETTTASSKTARLRCLSLIIFKSSKRVEADNKLVQGALVECINYMKDINEKCRIEAQNLLLKIGDALLVTSKGQEQYLGILMAGFMGNTQMVVGTILGLASSVHHFTGSLGIENLQMILKTICELLTSATREIVQACLSFIKVYITRLPLAQVANDLQLVVQALCKMQEDTKRHFRIKLRNILDRLVRKFDADTISNLVPTSDVIMHKRLRNLRKLNSRKKRAQDKKDQEDEDDAESDDGIHDFIVNSKPKTVEAILADSDDDIDDNEETELPSTKRRQKKTNAWIQEDENNIVDFTDTSAISKIRATNPQQAANALKKQKTTKENLFKTSADGRLIISDDLNDNSDDDKNDNDSDSDMDDTVSKATTLKLGAGGKRKRAASDSISIFSGGSNTRPAMKYRAGGSGIHRPVNKSSMDTGATYKARKAAGDVKKKGKVEPYAYLPLKRSLLNKRKRMKNSNDFKKVIQGVTKKDKRKNNKFQKGRRP